MNRYLKRIHQHGMFIKDISHSAGSHFYSGWTSRSGTIKILNPGLGLEILV